MKSTPSFAVMTHLQHTALSLGAPQAETADIQCRILNAAAATLPEPLAAEWTAQQYDISDFIAQADRAQWDLNAWPQLVAVADAYPITQGVDTPSVVSSLTHHTEQYRGLALSITHLHPASREWLTQVAQESADVLDRQYGFLIMLHDTLLRDKVLPLDLGNLIRQCMLAGYSQVILADDADTNPALPTFDQFD